MLQEIVSKRNKRKLETKTNQPEHLKILENKIQDEYKILRKEKLKEKHLKNQTKE